MNALEVGEVPMANDTLFGGAHASRGPHSHRHLLRCLERLP
jgi:hypothetical protein